MLYQLSYSRKWMTKVRGFFELSRGNRVVDYFFAKNFRAQAVGDVRGLRAQQPRIRSIKKVHRVVDF
jgi:hypothetical protein